MAKPRAVIVKDVDLFTATLSETIALHERVKADPRPALDAAAAIAGSLRQGGTLLLFGNGGSAADAEHAAAELVGRLERDRPAMAALALTANTSVLTSVANDA